LLADAGHKLTDEGGLASRCSQSGYQTVLRRQHTHGFYRVEILAALAKCVGSSSSRCSSLPAKIRETLSPSEISVQGGEVQGP